MLDIVLSTQQKTNPCPHRAYSLMVEIDDNYKQIYIMISGNNNW